MLAVLAIDLASRGNESNDLNKESTEKNTEVVACVQKFRWAICMIIVRRRYYQAVKQIPSQQVWKCHYFDKPR